MITWKNLYREYITIKLFYFLFYAKWYCSLEIHNHLSFRKVLVFIELNIMMNLWTCYKIMFNINTSICLCYFKKNNLNFLKDRFQHNLWLWIRIWLCELFMCLCYFFFHFFYGPNLCYLFTLLFLSWFMLLLLKFSIALQINGLGFQF